MHTNWRRLVLLDDVDMQRKDARMLGSAHLSLMEAYDVINGGMMS